MVDREGLLEHLRALDEALRDWERYRQKVSLRDLRSDRDARNMVLHAMLVAIQSAIGIAGHLIAEHRLRGLRPIGRPSRSWSTRGSSRESWGRSSPIWRGSGTCWSTSTGVSTWTTSTGR